MNEWLDNLTANNAFMEFAVIFLLATIVGVIAQFFKQPLLIMFIALGIIIGPSFLNVIKSTEHVQLLAEIGISILLFIVGLKLDLRIIKSIGKIALFTGLGQVIFTSVVGYFIGILLGFSALHSLYIAIALTFSSTIIIVKLLTDKKEMDSLHGQIAIGFLIIQDIVVILMMIVLTALGKEGGSSLGQELGFTFLKGIAFTIVIIMLMRWVMEPLSSFMAKLPELLLLFSVGWALMLAAVSHHLGFSSEVGAFMAGVSLASTSYREGISSRMISLRDFLLLFFFINLGAGLNLTTLGDQIPSAIIFSLFVLVGNPIIVMIIMGAMGYNKRTSFLAGLTVAQISEFSLLFAAMGQEMGHITEETVGLITLVGLITISMSTYLILYSQKIFEWISPMLSIFEKKSVVGEDAFQNQDEPPPDVIIIGMGRFGRSIAETIEEKGQRYFGVDMDPFLVKELQLKQKPVIYGDLEDPGILEVIPWQNAHTIYSTVADVNMATRFVKDLHANNFKGKIVVAAKNHRDAELLRDKCDAEIIIPYVLAGKSIVADHVRD